jgi:hypothetical protein
MLAIGLPKQFGNRAMLMAMRRDAHAANPAQISSHT